MSNSYLGMYMYTNNIGLFFRYSSCISFNQTIEIHAEDIKVKCKDRNFQSVYENVHTIINPNILTKKVRWKTDNIPPSVIFLGIDSMSKMNFARALPKSHSFLETNDFINLKGYTKIGENTFPNLVSILTGKTKDEIYRNCNPAKHELNSCEFIWDKFRKLGFITAYGEDETAIGTFNYQRTGFKQKPTDFYLRPYMLAAESLKSFKVNSLTVCSGPENTGERIMSFVTDFAKIGKNYPKFGLFWINSFSHENINLPSSMDNTILKFLQNIYEVLDNTFLIFLSDHGFRFDQFRWSNFGWFEDKLPFIYIYVPDTFKKKHKAEYLNLLDNGEKLTNPFDLHMTLQHLLKMSNATYEVTQSTACTNCHSLFKPIDEKRTCQDAAISQQWCLCQEPIEVDKNTQIVKQAANYIVSEVNNLVQSSNKSKTCAYYYLKTVVSSLMTENYKNNTNRSKHLTISLITIPYARFEATVQTLENLHNISNFQIVGRIIRINRYADDTKCIYTQLKEYCYCRGLITSITSAISHMLNFVQ